MSNHDIRLAPSILSADFTEIGQAVRTIEQSGARLIHLDIMDGQFVPNLTFGPKMVEDIRATTSLPLDVHLMINTPEVSVEQYLDAGADIVTFHIEACVHAHRLVQRINLANARAGVAIVPSTPVSTLQTLLPEIDQVLVMTVNPGFGGQQLIPGCVEKIRQLADERAQRNLSFALECDGGVDETTAPALIEAGVEILVAGSAFFGNPSPRLFVENVESTTAGRSNPEQPSV